MKFSIITEDTDHKVHLSHTADTKFFERIQHDVRKGIVADFRREMTWKNTPQAVKRYHQIPRVCPTALLARQENGALRMESYNGLLLFDVKPLVNTEAKEEVKRRALSMPTTLAAFEGASGRSVKVLVRVAGPNGLLPQTETEVERFYAEAHAELLPIYQALLSPHPIVPDCRGVRHAFLMPLDEAPQLNLQAQPFTIGERKRQAQQEYDWKAFDLYKKDFEQAVMSTREETGLGPNIKWDEDFVVCLSANLHRSGMPCEEAFMQIARHLYFYTDGMTRDQLRLIVDKAYDEDDSGRKPQSGNTMRTVVRVLEQRYQFRHNIIMGYTEYRQRSSYYSQWKPVTERVVNELTLELQVSDIPAWNRDVKRYVDSKHVPDYDIVEEYLLELGQKWDGQDHIRQLARTVPTRSREWPEWFHRFFLGMVAQWQHRNRRFGNAIVPLLISRQGYHKSDFCRQLLPETLRSWGYTDTLSLSEERNTLQAMTQMLLICFDEFNQISPKKQEGFLKNIITLPTVKVKRPYARHIEDLPRLASFIATTNQPDVLADPSGSRRFVGIFVDGDIDTSQTPNYEQLFAQAIYELNKGERYWFDEQETEAVMRHNRQFQLRSEAMVFFMEYFDIPRSESEGKWMTAANILTEVKNRARGMLSPVPSVNKFARELRSLSGIRQKSTQSNNFYLVRPRQT